MLLDTDTFTYGSFCAQTFLHTDAFRHRHFYIRKLLRTDAFTRRRFTRRRFTRRHFYTQTILYTGAFTHSCFYTDAFTHGQLLHTTAFTHRRFWRSETVIYTQRLLHTDAFTRQEAFTRRLLHTDTFARQKLLHTGAYDTDAFTREFFSILAPDNMEILILPQFLAIEPRFVRKGCDGNKLKSQFYLMQFLIGRTSFRAKGLRRDPDLDNFTHILPQFLAIEPHFVRKGCAGRLCKSQFYLSFWRSNLISCERGCAGTL